jgi:transcriptional regulator with XRE-family HTH domain
VQSDEPSIESRFGDAVLKGRQALGLSQKTLAHRLTERGLAVDASAISRIEKGGRAIRLSEAEVIANALGFTLADVEQALDPQDDFERRREAIGHALFAALQKCIDVADELDGLAWLVERHPEVMSSLDVSQDKSVPKDAPELIARIEQEWLHPSSAPLHLTIGTSYLTTELRDAARSLLGAVAHSAIDEAIGVSPNE